MITGSACPRVERDPELLEPALELRATRPSTEAERAAHVRRARTSLIDAEWEWLLRRAETLDSNETSAGDGELERRTLPPPPFCPEALSTIAPASLEPVDLSVAVDAADEGETRALEAVGFGRAGRSAFGRAAALVTAALVSLLAIIGLRTPGQSPLSSAAPAPGIAKPTEVPTPPRQAALEAAKIFEDQALATASPEIAAGSAKTETGAPAGGSGGRVREVTVRRGRSVSVTKKRSHAGSDNPY